MRIPRCREPRPAAPAAARGRARAGAHLCGPPAAARPPARSLPRDSLQSPRNLSALRVWQRCLEKGSAEAAHSCSSPSGSPTPRSRALPSPPPAAPLFGRGARPLARRSKTWSSLPGPLGRNLGPLGLKAASHSRSWSPGAARASVWILGGRRKELAGFGESSSGAQREPAAVPGARIAARLEAESALGNCLRR